MLGVLTDRQNTVEESPLDEHRGFDGAHNDGRLLLPAVPENSGPQTVSLSALLDLAISSTNRDFQVLIEALQKKTEADRKVAILQFSDTTRVVFLKLYALVKWLKASKKFEQLSNICYFLDQLSDYFIESADSFVQIAREELIFARIPLYHISTAIDALSLGTFPRLPVSIKKQFIREPPLNKRQKKLTLKWMCTMINYRLTQESMSIPAGFSEVIVKDGVATFVAPNKFKVCMVLKPTKGKVSNFVDDSMNNWCWRVRKVDILVSDYEVGFGCALVHPLQNKQLAEFCNERLKHCIDDVRIVYEILHDFTLKLQLDVIFCHVQYLSKTISDRYIAVEAYDAPGGLLSILYWINDRARNTSPYRITIEYNSNQPFSGLVLRHHPFNITLPTLKPQNGFVNFGQLFNKIILFRCRERLYSVKHALKTAASKSCCIRLVGDAAVRLSYSLLSHNDCTDEEYLNITVNNFTGRIQCNLLALPEETEELSALEFLLDHSFSIKVDQIYHILRKLQALLLLKRYEKATSNFQFRQITPSQMPMIGMMNRLSRHRIYLQFIDEPQYYLVLTLDIKHESEADLRFFLVDFSLSKFTMVELILDEMIRSSAIADLDDSEIDIRRDYKTMFSKHSFTGHIKQIQVAMSTVADRILFIRISEELRKHGIEFNQPVREKLVGGYVLRLKNISSIVERRNPDFFDKFVECSIRWSFISRVWPFECTLKDIPLVNDYKRSKEEIKLAKSRVLTHVEEINPWQHQITTISGAINAHVVDRLKIYTNMISAVYDFSLVYEEVFSQHCNVYLFNYHKLMLLYGRHREKVLIFSWKPRMNGFLLNFAQNTYHNQESSLNSPENHWNSHAFVYDFLSNKYNKNHDLIGLVTYLINTERALECILYFSNPILRSLKTYAVVTNCEDRCASMEIKSHVVALTENRIRMCYGAVNIDYQLLNENQCAVQASRLKDLSSLTENNEFVSLPFFVEFWNSHSGGKSICLRNDLLNSGNEIRPLSVPQNRLPSPRDPLNPLSCPPQVDILLNEGQLPQTSSACDQETGNSSLLSAVIVDGLTFEKAMSKTEKGDPGPFESYLHGITLIARFGASFYSMWHGNSSRVQLPFANYRFNSRSVHIDTVGISCGPNPAWNVSIKIYLCAYDFKLKCKLEICGMNAPTETDVNIFETYFEKVVAPSGNEYAVISFLTVCRTSSWPVFVAFARLMQAHMESLEHTGEFHPQLTGLSNHWCVGLQMTASRDKLHQAIFLNDKVLLFTLNLHSRQRKPNTRLDTKHITLQYNVETNQIFPKAYQVQQEYERQDHVNLECLVQEMPPLPHTECVIWPCIRRILEHYRSVRN
ncbi:Mediator complex subunit rgr-1 [Aphelenchoides bicaudatus]|nr:Mediator complex subunit rgr-1 [Aphelenchoides bicaudatus]